MKKLLLLPIIFVLVSCQPSELDRCIEAKSKYQDLSEENIDTYITFNNDYKDRIIFHKDSMSLQKVPCESYKKELATRLDDYDCSGIENLIVLNYYDGTATASASIPNKYLVDFIKERVKDSAKEACHREGIY
jgi:hypothetical protein